MDTSVIPSVPMPTAVVPVPPGFAVEGDALSSQVRAGRLSKFQDQGSELQLYLSKDDFKFALDKNDLDVGNLDDIRFWVSWRKNFDLL